MRCGAFLLVQHRIAPPERTRPGRNILRIGPRIGRTQFRRICQRRFQSLERSSAIRPWQRCNIGSYSPRKNNAHQVSTGRSPRPRSKQPGISTARPMAAASISHTERCLNTPRAASGPCCTASTARKAPGPYATLIESKGVL
jgi:hypothetical protein